jgi:hypothetical protein
MALKKHLTSITSVPFINSAHRQYLIHSRDMLEQGFRVWSILVHHGQVYPAGRVRDASDRNVTPYCSSAWLRGIPSVGIVGEASCGALPKTRGMPVRSGLRHPSTASRSALPCCVPWLPHCAASRWWQTNPTPRTCRLYVRLFGMWKTQAASHDMPSLSSNMLVDTAPVNDMKR